MVYSVQICITHDHLLDATALLRCISWLYCASQDLCSFHARCFQCIRDALGGLQPGIYPNRQRACLNPARDNVDLLRP